MQENTDQKKLRIETLFTQWNAIPFLDNWQYDDYENDYGNNDNEVDLICDVNDARKIWGLISSRGSAENVFAS